MGLNNITLTPRLVADLYHDVLFESNTTVMPQNAPFRYLGDNKKNILIVTTNEDAVFLPDNELLFLTNVLSACGFGLADVAVINWKNSGGRTMTAIYESTTATSVLLFDVTPGEFGLPINFPEFQVQKFDNRSYMFGPSLSIVEKDPALKKQLWTALQKLFNIQPK